MLMTSSEKLPHLDFWESLQELVLSSHNVVDPILRWRLEDNGGFKRLVILVDILVDTEKMLIGDYEKFDGRRTSQNGDRKIICRLKSSILNIGLAF